MTCSVEGCFRSDKMTKGMCNGHYSRWFRLGDVLADVPLGPARRGRGRPRLVKKQDEEIPKRLEGMSEEERRRAVTPSWW